MRENGPIVVLVAAVLAFLGIRGFSPDGGGPSKGELNGRQAAPSRSGEKESKDPPDSDSGGEETAGYLRPVLDFQNTGAGSAVAGKEQAARGLDVPGWQTRYLIACVPDPLDSSSGYRFDSLIDAIQRAAETQGYVLDRYYYPWSHKGPAKASAAPAPFDVEVRMALTKGRWEKREIHFAARGKPSKHPGRNGAKQGPGVLQFRGAPRPASVEDSLSYWGLVAPLAPPFWPSLTLALAATKAPHPPRLLQIFLVGETATAGIHKQAFTASLDLIGKSGEYNRDGAVRVLGPHFSGSQVSLERTLRAWAGAPSQKTRPPKFTIISGNATAINKAKLEASIAPAKVEFHATRLPETEVLKATLRYLGVAEDTSNSFKFKHEIAIVYESNTTFGERIYRVGRRSSGEQPVFFPFPLHVSEVRSAYQQASGSTKNDTLNLPSFGSKLRLPLDSGQPRDTEPSLDHAMTAATTERILGSMLNTIARERFRYAIILASDLKDKLFLASLLRKRCPETRLILSGNDLMFSHPDFSAAMRGAVVASTYPLYPSNQHWSLPAHDARRRHIVFPGEEEQGAYNATVALLSPGDSRTLLDYVPPFPALQTGNGDPRLPPIWITIVGQGGPFPLAAIPLNPDDPGVDYLFPRPGEGKGGGVFRPLYPTLWIIPVLGVTLLLVYVFSAYFAALCGRDRWGPVEADEMRKLFCPRKDSSGAGSSRRQQQFYTFFCLTSVLVLYVYLTFVWLIPFNCRRVYGKDAVELRWWNWIAPIALVSLLLLILGAFGFLRVVPWFQSAWGWVFSKKASSTGGGQPKGNLPGHNPVAAQARGNNAATPPSPGFGEVVVEFRLVLLILFLGVLAVYYFVNGRPEPKRVYPGEGLLFVERATSLASGVSPVAPAFLLAMAFFCWGCVQLKRQYLLGPPHAVGPPFPEKDFFEQVMEGHDHLTKDLSLPERALKRTGAWVVWVALLFTFSRLASRFVPSVEGVWTESLILLGFAGLSVLIGYSWLHLCQVWKSTRELLDALALLPLGEAFKRVPGPVTNMFGPYLSSERPGRQGHLPFRQEQAHLLAEEYKRVRQHLRAATDYNLRDLADLDTAMRPPVGAVPGPWLDADLRTAAQACLLLLQHVWSDPVLAEKFAEPPSPKPSEAAGAAPPLAVHVEKTVQSGPGLGSTARIIEDIEPKPHADTDQLVRNWLTRSQDFAALEVTVYLSQFFVHLRNLILFMTVTPFLMLLAVTSYPFQPQRLWLMLAAALIGVGTTTVIWIVIQIERNEVVSHILNTTPNRLNFHWHFLGQILVYAAPLLAVVVAGSSDASDLVHSLVDPVIQALR